MPEEIPGPPVSPQEVQIQSPSFLNKLKIHKFKILGGVLGILVFAGAVFGAYKFGQRQVQPGPQPTPTPEAVATPTPDPTANWKTYTNKEMGFSFRFPAELSLQESPISIISNLPTVIARLKHNNIQDYPLVDLTIARTDMSIEEWIKSKDDCPETFDSCTSMISGPIPSSVQFESINRHYGGIDTYLKKDDIIFDFALGVKQPNQPPKQNERQLYNQMLSTFRFLEDSAYKCVEESSLNCAEEIELSFQCTEEYQTWAKENCPGWKKYVYCEDPRPEVCTMECIQNPPYICGSDGNSYCSTCQACAEAKVKWYVIQNRPCGTE